MIRISGFFLAALFVGMLFTSCSKEYSLENGVLPGSGGSGGTQSGTAVYTLAGAPANCLTPAISGTYQVGTVLDASNIAVLVVDVTTIGTYVISTGTSNGIKFTGAGTFSVTGSQVLVLTGSGTPLAAGTNNFSPGTNGCTFSITTTVVPPTPPAVGILDCTTATLAGTFTQSIPLTTANTVSIPVNVTTAGTYSITTTGNGVSFSGSGTLALGAQTIVLTGNGTGNNSGAITFPLNFGTSTCNFEVTFLPAPPPAVGTLDCATAIIAGVYTDGNILTASNTVTIPVNVTTAGLYSISTGPVNGITFSSSGVIAAGAQNIVLTGVGIPINAGPFTYPVTLGASNCDFSITYLPGLPSTDYFRVKIDGVLTTFHVDLTGDDTPLGAGFFSNYVSGDAAAGSSESLDIGVNSASPLTTGTYLHPLGLKFATSHYIDASGDGWQPADASSPAFSVVVTAISATRITGTFSGQYKDLNGTGTGSKIFTQGEFSVPIP